MKETPKAFCRHNAPNKSNDNQPKDYTVEVITQSHPHSLITLGHMTQMGLVSITNLKSFPIYGYNSGYILNFLTKH